MKIGYHISLILSLLFLISCSSLKVVEYEIKHIPNIKLSDTVSVAFVNNVTEAVVLNNPTVCVIPDTVANTLFNSLVESFRKSDFPYLISEKSISLPTGKALCKKEVSYINNGDSVNSIISLNRLKMYPSYRMGAIDDDWYAVDLFIPSEAHISIYEPFADTITSYTCIDTLVFYGAGYTKEEAMLSLPKSNECIKEVIESITKVASKQYQPESQKVARIYFASTKRMMRKADTYWRKGMYDEASYIWDYLYENKKSKLLQAKTAANLAMYEEMNHNYERALMWARISFTLCSRKKSVYDPEIAYLSDYIQQLRLHQREQQTSIINSVYIFD